MNVFVSWSGERSNMLAKALARWIPLVLQGTEVFYSPESIVKGDLWMADLAQSLEETNFGIVCVTRENQNQPWLLYEAGALSKLNYARVIPYTLDFGPGELTGPLGALNGASAAKDKKQDENAPPTFEHAKEETFKIVRSLNLIRPVKLEMSQLRETFDVWWPKLEEKIRAIPDSELPPPEAPELGDEVAEMKRILRHLSEQLDRRAQSHSSHWGGSINPADLSEETRNTFLNSIREFAADSVGDGFVSPEIRAKRKEGLEYVLGHMPVKVFLNGDLVYFMDASTNLDDQNLLRILCNGNSILTHTF